LIPRAVSSPSPPTGPGYYSLLDVVTGNYRENPPKFGYPRFAVGPIPNFDSDWRYVDQPGYDADILEKLHRIHVGDNGCSPPAASSLPLLRREQQPPSAARTTTTSSPACASSATCGTRTPSGIFVEGMSSQDFNYNPKLARP